MILTRRAALGGIQLDELHERIVIKSIDPGMADENITAVSRMGGAGQRITGAHFNMLEATITYGIDVPKQDLAARREIVSLVNAWARRKAWLTTNEMPGRQMYVDKTVLQSPGDLWEWTNDYTIGFRAYNVPFWQDIDPAAITSGTVSSGSWRMEIPGTVETVLDVDYLNKSGKEISRFSITAGGKTITLEGIGLAANKTLSIHHGTDGLLRITSGGTSVLTKRTGADDLTVNPGTVSISFSADRSGVLTIRAAGRYL